MDKLLIDFFEFQVLVEAAWYSGTILRHSIMQKAINVWYKHLSENERERTYDFFLRTKEDEIKLEIQKSQSIVCPLSLFLCFVLRLYL